MDVRVGCTTGMETEFLEWYVFTSSCGLCCLWKLKCGGLLTCGDRSLAFFDLVLYFTEKLDSIVEIAAE